MGQLNAHIRVRTGSRSGFVLESQGTPIRVGRDEGLELQFDPHADLEVSARHATITRERGGWWVTDDGSRNGTYVNGRKIAGRTALNDRDQVAFGAKGPIVEVRIVDPDSTRDFAAPATQPQRMGSRPTPTTTRIRAEVARRTKPLKWTLVSVALGLSAIIAALVIRNQRDRQSWEVERKALLARVDSALTTSGQTITSLRGDLKELATALQSSEEAVRTARANLEQAHTKDASQIPALRATLTGALATLDNQQAIARLNRDQIRSRNDHAVAKVFVAYQSGAIVTGTAFAVRSDATLITCAHLLTGPDGSPAKRVVIQFSYSDQTFPARILVADNALDLAVVKVDSIEGIVPTVSTLSLRPDTLPEGEPVLLIGYPLGGESTPSSRAGHSIISPVVSAGSVVKATATRIDVRGYGATGSSGSPMFDSRGDVVGVVFGGRADTEPRTVAAVPSAAALRLMGMIPP